jgi:HAD superfamily hydrolase (TIGR01509 family)
MHDVLQLANVSGPGVVQKPGDGAFGQLRPCDSEASRVGIQEVHRERQDVLAAVAQRGERQVRYVEAVVEVFAKSALGHRLQEVGIRCGDEAHVNRDRAPCANPHDLMLLKDSEEFHLRAERQIGHFVQEESPFVGSFKPSLAAGKRAGKRAPLVTEKLALEKRRCEGAAVDRNERRRCAGASVVQMPGDDFLAGARFARDQNCRAARRKLLDLSQQRAGRRRFKDERPCPHGRGVGSRELENGHGVTPKVLMGHSLARHRRHVYYHRQLVGIVTKRKRQAHEVREKMPVPSYPQSLSAVIFDCDGVLLDSELLGLEVQQRALASVGLTYDLTEYQSRFLGLHYRDQLRALDADAVLRTGKHLPTDFGKSVSESMLKSFASRLRPVEGAAQFVGALTLPKAVASSSTMRSLEWKLVLTGLRVAFGEHVYSGEQVRRGKPAPDLFLFAARGIGATAETTLVLEDSAHGIRGAKAAGMIAGGFTGGGHCGPHHQEMLISAGADAVFPSFSAVGAFLAGRG